MNPFKIVLGYLSGVLKALGGQLKVKLIDWLKSYAVDELGILAIDAVNYANTLIGSAGDEKKAAAKSKLLADLKAAGKDVESFSESLLNFLIESALQAVLAGVTK